jgi:hypothetical protein
MGGAEKMTLKETYRNAAPVGVYPLNNFGGLAVLDIINDEAAVCAWHYGGGYESIRRHQIFYTYTGRAYVRKAGRRFYLDQIMRTNGGY